LALPAVLDLLVQKKFPSFFFFQYYLYTIAITPLIVLIIIYKSGMFALAAAIDSGSSLQMQYFLCFALIFYAPCSPLMIAWLSKAYSDSSTAAFGPAAVLMIGSIGGFIGPNVYGSSESYVQGHFIMGCVFSVGAILAACMKYFFIETPTVLKCACHDYARLSQT
jgi:hypothetical protein